MSKCDPECGLHLKVDVSVDGQDSPYQVAAPCWLAELTLKVNMLKMTVIMLLMTFIALNLDEYPSQLQSSPWLPPLPLAHT